jgi:hypothetical protein
VALTQDYVARADFLGFPSSANVHDTFRAHLGNGW